MSEGEAQIVNSPAPKGWPMVALSEVCEKPQYGLSHANTAGGATPIVGMKDMKGGRISRSALALTTVTEREQRAFRLRDGDILLNRTNSRELVGKLAVWDHGDDALVVFASYLVRYPIRADCAFPLYVLSCLEQPQAQQQIDRLITSGVSQANINPTAFYEEVDIPLAPLAVQVRIVAVIDLWDRAIDQTQRLIATKRQRKTALLQQLLHNLPKRPLMEAADVWFSGVDKKSRPEHDPVLLCNYMDVFHNSRITSDMVFMEATASKGEIAANTLRKHDVVFTKDSETSGEIAEPALVAEDIPRLVCGYHLAVARPRAGVGHGPFIAQAMRHKAIRWQFSRLANGVVRFGLTLDAMEQAEIFLPSLPVQEKIARILDAEDTMIEGLTKQVETLRGQKRGLMQKLLTGEWRLDDRFDATPVAALPKLVRRTTA